MGIKGAREVSRGLIWGSIGFKGAQEGLYETQEGFSWLICGSSGLKGGSRGLYGAQGGSKGLK